MKFHIWYLLLIPHLLSTACQDKKSEDSKAAPEPQETVIEETVEAPDRVANGHETDTYDTEGSTEATTHIENTYMDAYGNLIYTVVQQNPVFAGGNEALQTYLKDHLSYPPEALSKSAFGTVHVAFIIGIDGSIRDVEVASGLEEPSLNQEAMRLISEMPNWTPGMQNGEKVNVKYTLPVTFDRSPEQ